MHAYPVPRRIRALRKIRPRLASVALLGAALVCTASRSHASEGVFQSNFDDGIEAAISNVVLETSPDQLPGRLYIPPNANGAAVVLMHGCTGMWQSGVPNSVAQAAIEKWGVELAANGFIALAIDSYTSRTPPHESPNDWQDQCSGTVHAGAVDPYTTRVADIDEGVDWLRYHFGSAVEQIGLLGWSQGGEATLVRSAETSRDDNVSLYTAPGDTARAFVASVVFYPGCGLSLGFADAPRVDASFWRPHWDMRFNLAELDPLAPDCDRRSVVALSDYGSDTGSGHAVATTTYENANHSFDTTTSRWPTERCLQSAPPTDACAAANADIDSLQFFNDRLRR